MNELEVWSDLVLSFATNVNLGAHREEFLLTMTYLCSINSDFRLTVYVLQ